MSRRKLFRLLIKGFEQHGFKCGPHVQKGYKGRLIRVTMSHREHGVRLELIDDCFKDVLRIYVRMRSYFGTWPIVDRHNIYEGQGGMSERAVAQARGCVESFSHLIGIPLRDVVRRKSKLPPPTPFLPVGSGFHTDDAYVAIQRRVQAADIEGFGHINDDLTVGTDMAAPDSDCWFLVKLKVIPDTIGDPLRFCLALVDDSVSGYYRVTSRLCGTGPKFRLRYRLSLNLKPKNSSVDLERLTTQDAELIRKSIQLYVEELVG